MASVQDAKAPVSANTSTSSSEDHPQTSVAKMAVSQESKAGKLVGRSAFKREQPLIRCCLTISVNGSSHGHGTYLCYVHLLSTVSHVRAIVSLTSLIDYSLSPPSSHHLWFASASND